MNKSILLRAGLSFLLASSVLTQACSGCQADLDIVSPKRAAMISGSDAVSLLVSSTASEVKLGDKSLQKGDDGTFTDNLPAATGLGFVAVNAGERVAVRAWQQGAFAAAETPLDDGLQIRLGHDALNDGSGSLAHLIAMLFQDAELAGFADSEMMLDDTFGSPMRINLLSAHSPQVLVNLNTENDALAFSAQLKELSALYSTCSNGYISTGELHFANLQIQGLMHLSPSGGEASELVVDLGEMHIDDDGGLPQEVLQQVLDLLAERIKAEIKGAAQSAAPIVATQLLKRLTPAIGVALNKPISSSNQLSAIDIDDDGILLHYTSRIVAENPSVATDNQSRLVVDGLGAEETPAENMHVRTGAALLNQILYAAWDAGNFANLTLTKEALVQAGMAELDFPYDTLLEVNTQLLLPPLLSWQDDGAILAMGGVKMNIKADGVDDSQAWTSLDLPVQLQMKAGQLFLLPDSSRAVKMRATEFKDLNDFANPTEVSRLMQTAMPTALKLVFARFPALDLAPYNISRVDGKSQFSVRPHILDVQQGQEQWNLNIDLELCPAQSPASDTDGGMLDANSSADAGTDVDAACDQAVQTVLQISTPQRGLVVDGENPPQLNLNSDASQLQVNGEPQVLSQGNLQMNLPAVEGLGFVEILADQRRAVRSWLQGDVHSSTAVIDNSVAIHLGSAALGGEQNSLANLLAMMLKSSQLASLINNPLQLSGSLPVNIDVYVTSAKAGAVNVQLSNGSNDLQLNAELLNVQTSYQTHSPCVAVSGQLSYPYVQLTGRIHLDESGGSLLDAEVNMGEAQLDDSGAIPLEVIEALLQSSQASIKQAVIDAADRAAHKLGHELLGALLPVVQLDFPKPISQASGLQTLQMENNGVSLTYGSRIQAETSLLATSGQGPILPASEAANSDDPQISLRLTARMINALAFALWDAGNFENLRWTREELQALGMPTLDFPYNIFEDVSIKTLLAPVLRWDDDGAWMDLGGIEMNIHAAGVGDTRAWTAASVPIKLIRQSADLQLVVDHNRQAQLRSIEFEQLNPLAQEDQVITLMRTTSPAIIDAVFAHLPLINMPEFNLELPDGTPGPVVQPQLQNVQKREAGWDLSLTMNCTVPPQQDPEAIVPGPVTGSCDSALPGQLNIDSPARGLQMANNDTTAMTISSSFGQVFMGGEAYTTDNDGKVTVDVDPADGLVFVAASAGQRHAVRAWQQGTFLPSNDWQTSTLAIDLGADILNSGTNSLAGLSAELLSGAELASFVNNPIHSSYTVTIPPFGSENVPIDTTITSAISPSVDVSLQVNANQIDMNAVLHNLIADYTATATGTGGFNSSGTVSYEQITVTGELQFTGDTASLINASVVSASDPVIEDSGGMPAAAVSAVLTAMDADIKAAIVDATKTATSRIATDLMQQLRPAFGADFDPPVDQISRVQQSQVHSAGVMLIYDTEITAQSPSIAANTDGVLQRTVNASFSTASDLRAVLGSPLVNQLAFAAWDAGDFNAINLSQAELSEQGLPDLAFPYNLLSSVEIKLLLSPLLEWDATGAWLDLGGIELLIHVDGVEDTQAWTSARLPVLLVPSADGQSLNINNDSSRQIQNRAVEIADLNPFAKIDDVNHLIDAAVPAVVNSVFTRVPAMRLPRFTVKKLDDSAGPILQVKVQSVDTLSDAWLLHLQLQR